VPATTAQDSHDQLDERGLQIQRAEACNDKLGDVFHNEEGFMQGAIAKLSLFAHGETECPNRAGDLRSEVNTALRFQQVKSKPGTTSDHSPFCARTGEYDVALAGYITLVERFGSLLDDDVRDHIVNDLLNLRGPFDTDDNFPCAQVSETENHLNLMESSRYLTNQLLYSATGGNPIFDNEANGMNRYMLT